MNRVNTISFFRGFYRRTLILPCIPLLLCCYPAFSENLHVKQVLIDGKDSIDGLDNPRQVKVSPDGEMVFVTSADDNSLLALKFKEQLTPLALFKNSAEHGYKLEGASGISIFNNGNSIAIASFYDSAMALFKKTSPENIEFIKAYSDDLGYERVFKSNKSLANEDKLGLLGVFDVASDGHNSQLYAASYKSNGIAVFDITKKGALKFNSKLAQGENWNTPGGPVTLAGSHINKTLVVAGFNSNTLSVFSKQEDGKLALRQTIKNGENGIRHLLNPQKLIFSSDEKFLYVACSGSSAVMIFEHDDNEYLYRQTITHKDTGGQGLTGVGSLALSANGTTLYAAGEFDQGLLIFDVEDNGRLIFNHNYQPTKHKIEGVTSIETDFAGNNLFLTLGKMDALFWLTEN